MYLLAVDTATNSGGVALSRNAETVGLWMCKTPLRYAESLIPWIEEMLDAHSLAIRDIDCFAVSVGPGSFTGIRIGLAAVKGMAQGLDKPVIGIGTLEALAHRYRWAGLHVASMIDARRQQVFAGLFAFEGGEVVERIASRALPPAEFLRGLPEDECLLVGDGAEFYASGIAAIRPQDRLVIGDNCILESLCRIGYRRLTQGRTSPASDVKAVYLRPSDARLPDGAGSK